MLTLNFVTEKTINIWKKYIDLQSQAIYVDNIFSSKKNLHVLEDGANRVQVNILGTLLSKICLKK
jgi:hypothetical protein